MIVERRTFLVKQGCQATAIEMLKQEIEGNTAFTHSYRIYAPDIGPYGVIVVEWEYEDLQEMRASWDAWFAKPGIPEFYEKWFELTERGGHREIWALAAQR
jgi:hypothetical protein